MIKKKCLYFQISLQIYQKICRAYGIKKNSILNMKTKVMFLLLKTGEGGIAPKKGGGIAQNKGGMLKPCIEQYPNNDGKCDIKQCKAECARKRKQGLGRCMDTGEGIMQCRCDYVCP